MPAVKHCYKWHASLVTTMTSVKNGWTATEPFAVWARVTLQEMSIGLLCITDWYIQSTYGLNSLNKGDEHPTHTPVRNYSQWSHSIFHIFYSAFYHVHCAFMWLKVLKSNLHFPTLISLSHKLTPNDFQTCTLQIQLSVLESSCIPHFRMWFIHGGTCTAL